MEPKSLLTGIELEKNKAIELYNREIRLARQALDEMPTIGSEKAKRKLIPFYEQRIKTFTELLDNILR